MNTQTSDLSERFVTKPVTHILTCARSGVPIGTLNYVTCAGAMPYLSHWKEMVALHPIFSLPTPKLLAFARNEWNRLSKASEDEQTTTAENTLLRVAFLAVFHSLDSVVQEAPSLPPIHIVQTQMTRLFALAYWKHYLESKRFAFPTFKINRLNANDRFENVHHYLDACFAIRDAYSKNIDELIEKEKIESADRALKALRNSWIVPVGNKALYRWVRAHLPEKYSADGQGWMSTLFCGNERTVLDFDTDETELMMEIIEGECPAGTAIMKAVRDRLEQILKIQKDHREAFSVDFEDYLPTDPASVADIPVVALSEPKQEDFDNKVLFIKARANWYLQQRAISNAKASEL